jgi:hypothetical protein
LAYGQPKTYSACPLQEHLIADFIDAKHFAKLFGGVIAVGNSVSRYDVPILYSIPWSNGLDFLHLERLAFEPMSGKWQKVLEVPCERRVRGRLENLSFAQMHGHFVQQLFSTSGRNLFMYNTWRLRIRNEVFRSHLHNTHERYTIMPREFRKRGKKMKKAADKGEWTPSQDDLRPREEDHAHLHDDLEEESRAGPSWIIPVAKDSEETNLEAPFGYLDADVKAYFRTVNVQIRNWQDNGVEVGEDVDPNEGAWFLLGVFGMALIQLSYHSDRRLFFIAALTEMSNKEKQLATDPDCSNILERMTYSMDDFARRVFIDRLAGS